LPGVNRLDHFDGGIVHEVSDSRIMHAQIMSCRASQPVGCLSWTGHGRLSLCQGLARANSGRNGERDLTHRPVGGGAKAAWFKDSRWQYPGVYPEPQLILP
jgi:hypothetical protein